MLGAAQKQAYKYDDAGNVVGFQPYIPYGATVDAAGNITNTAQEQAQAAVAGFAPMQEQAFRQVAQMQVPGQYGVGSMFAGAGGMGAANLAQQAAGAGQQYYGLATDPFAQQAFMSPYMQNAVNRQKFEAMRDYDIGLAKQRQQAVGAGAFGGSRMAIAEAEANRNLQQQLQNIQAAGTQRAFEQGQQAQQFGANLGLQGYGTALQGTGQLTAAGRTLADIGGQQLQAQQGIIGLQSQAGAQQQALEQQRINQAIQNYALQQQYPQLQLSTMSSLLRGLPLQQATTQQYQAAPSAISQIGGLGATGVGLYGLGKGAGIFGKEGGHVRKLAKGGITGLSKRVLMNPEDFSAQQIDSMTKKGMISQLVGLPVLDAKMKDEQRMKMAQAAQQPQPADTIAAEIMARAAAAQGIDSAESNLPVMSAFDGGIVAMAEGGETPPAKPAMSIAPPEGYTFEQASGKYIDNDQAGGVGAGIAAGLPPQLSGRARFIAAMLKDAGMPFEFGGQTYAQGGEVKHYQAGGTMAGFDDSESMSSTSSASPEIEEYVTDPLTGERLYSGYGSKKPATTPAAPAPKKDTGIKILPDAPRPQTGATPPVPPAVAESDSALSGKGIADILKRYEETLGKGEARDKEAKKEAFWSSLAEFGFGAMAGSSPFAATNIGQAGVPAVKSGVAALRDVRAREEKRGLARAQLGLEGEKIGADFAKLRMQEPYFRAYAQYLARRPGSTSTAGLGSVTPAVADKVMTRFQGYEADPKSAPFFAQLPKDVQTGLTKYKPGTESYNRSMQLFRQYNDRAMQNYLNSLKGMSAKSAVTADED
jgi:hypothetical protein